MKRNYVTCLWIFIPPQSAPNSNIFSLYRYYITRFWNEHDEYIRIRITRNKMQLICMYKISKWQAKYLKSCWMHVFGLWHVPLCTLNKIKESWAPLTTKTFYDVIIYVQLSVWKFCGWTIPITSRLVALPSFSSTLAGGTLDTRIFLRRDRLVMAGVVRLALGLGLVVTLATAQTGNNPAAGTPQQR